MNEQGAIPLNWLGVTGLGWAAAVATTITDNLILVGAVLGALVALSTLLIRLFTVVDNRVTAVIHRMQTEGELPTRLERLENQRTNERLFEMMKELIDRLDDEPT